MKLAGSLIIGSERYLLTVHGQKSVVVYTLFSTMHREDRLALAQGLPFEHKTVESMTELRALSSEERREYVIGAIKQSKATARVSAYLNTDALVQVLDTLHYARVYHFNEKEIKLQKKETKNFMRELIEVERFSGKNDRLDYEYVSENGEWTEVRVRYEAINLVLGRTFSIPSVKGLTFSELPYIEQREIAKATLKTVTYKDLEQSLDMSWYKKDGCLQKDYRAVESVADFEAMFDDMMEEACRVERLVVALDTETTGVNIFELAKDNPVRDHCVEISISFRDNQSYCIFNDMEYFPNVEAEYCFKRLAQLFTEERDEIEVVWAGGKKRRVFPREHFHLVGQNSPFDRRVSIGEGAPIWFDDDTLNMGFTIDPRVVRGNIKLKNMTRRVFGHETPELTDVLGKGNEDKYRWLADKEVACIYAGADSDYTRKLFFALKGIMGERMYFQYHRQDVRMLNILAVSEYKGLRVKEKEAIELGNQTAENLKVLEQAAYRYVGYYMSFNQAASVIAGKYEAGLMGRQEYLEALEAIHPDVDASYEFEFTGADIRKVMYEILKYPIKARTDKGVPKTDKYVRKKLLSVKRKENSTSRQLQQSILVAGANYAEYERLLAGSDADKKKAKKMVLIDKDEFNKKEYPLVLIFEKYADLNKEYTSYFKPIIEGNMEGKIFKTYSLARIETRRIMNASQTMKKDLKKLIIPYNEDYWHLDFDLSQIELRLMYSLSHSDALIEKMKNPESDAHTETAAIVNHVPAYMVTSVMRKGAKGVSFGKPYGLGDRSMCETMFGEVNDTNLTKTRIVIRQWEQANVNVVKLLEDARAKALEPVELSLEKRNFMDAWQRDPETGAYLLDENGEKIPIPLGAVYNLLGFCRYFDLTDVDQTPEAKARRKTGKFTAREGAIRRQAGNYPIQSYAAEFFRTILYRFYDRCKAEGIADKVVWNMLIHDELLASVHKSVNPILIMKIVKESCMITMPGHTNYFVGINVGDNWKEAKDDSREAPVIFVNRLIKRWDNGEFHEPTWFEHPWDLIKPLRGQYVQDRIHECVREIQPGVDNEPLDYKLLLDRFENYMVRAYVNDYPLNFSIPKDTPENLVDDLTYLSHLESWILDVYGEGKEVKNLDGRVYKVIRNTEEVAVETAEDDFADDYREKFAEDIEMYDFDEDAVVEVFLSEAEDDGDEAEELQFDYSKRDGAMTVAEMTVVEHKYSNIKELNGCAVLSVDNDVQIEYLKSKINLGKGNLIMFRKPDGKITTWKRSETRLDLKALDNELSSLRQLPRDGALCMNDKIIFSVKNNEEVNRIMRGVRKYKGFGYKVLVKDTVGRITPVGQVAVTADFTEF